MTRKLRSKEKPPKKVVSVIEDDHLQEDEEQYNDESFREISIDDLHAGYDVSVHDWLLRNGLEKIGFVLRVYRYGGEAGTDRISVGKFTDHVPDADEIGRSFGAGKYDCILSLTDKNGKRRATSSRVICDEIYNEIRAEEKQAKLKALQISGVPANGVNNFDTMIESMGKFMVVLGPLLTRNNNQSGDMSAIMMENYKLVQSMMKTSIRDQQQIINDVQRGKLGLSETMEDLEETSGLMGLLTQIGPYIEKLLPLILGGKVQQKAAATIIKAAPSYMKITRDKKLLSGLIRWIEEKHGRETTKKVLSSLKLKRPIIVKEKEKVKA